MSTHFHVSGTGVTGPLAGPRSHYKWWVLVTAIFGAFVSILDATVVNTALPHIQLAFGTDLHTASYVVTGYLLAQGVVIAASGFLANRFGIKQVCRSLPSETMLLIAPMDAGITHSRCTFWDDWNQPTNLPLVPKPKVRPFWGSRMSHGGKVLATAAFYWVRQNAANAWSPRDATRAVRIGGGSGLCRMRRPWWV